MPRRARQGHENNINKQFVREHFMLRHLTIAGTLAALGTFAGTCQAQGDFIGEFIVFPAVTNHASFHGGLNGELQRRNIGSDIDFFATAEARGFSFLGELLVEDSEDTGDSADLERFQVGYDLGIDTRLWFGRYHNPVGIWNTQFHHGRYMETSITRPGFLLYEEQGGILPMHIFGFLLEHRQAVADGAIRYSLAVGRGPELSSGELRPVDVIRPTYGESGPATTVRLEYQPDEGTISTYALFLSQVQIRDDMTTYSDIDQRIAGASAIWQGNKLRLLASVFYVHNDIGSSISDQFGYGYVQAEYQWTPRWNTYARALASSGVNDDAYLAYFPHVYKDQDIAGVRFDFKNNQALKVEVDHVRVVGDDYDAFCFQWSAAFP